jgi:hypothetical protein
VAIPTSLVTKDGPLTVPFTYVLGANESFELASVSALWNGAGAIVSYWPCVSVYSQDGKLIGRYIPPQSVPAGDGAEVTYGPF